MKKNNLDALSQRLWELFDSHRKNAADFRRADMDEIAMVAKACGNLLPERLQNLIIGYDTGFSGTVGANAQFLERALRIFEVDSSLPKIEVISNNDELLPTFSLNEKDKERVLKLCGDMRKIVFASTDFDEPHKKRLLNRIAAIEEQVYSPRGLFDVVLGGVSDTGETLGKFGKDIKPLTERMSEIAKITRHATKEYDQIPAPEEVKKLPAPEETDE